MDILLKIHYSTQNETAISKISQTIKTNFHKIMLKWHNNCHFNYLQKHSHHMNTLEYGGALKNIFTPQVTMSNMGIPSLCRLKLVLWTYGPIKIPKFFVLKVMPYAMDFVLRSYVRFSQIGSHMFIDIIIAGYIFAFIMSSIGLVL